MMLLNIKSLIITCIAKKMLFLAKCTVYWKDANIYHWKDNILGEVKWNTELILCILNMLLEAI